jgi:hypothetical protein
MIAVLLFDTLPLQAGAWVQKKKGYYIKISTGYLRATEEYDHLGNKKNIQEDFEIYQNAAYEEITTTAYLEYGLIPRLTLVANLPFKVATNSRIESSNYFTGGQRDTSYTTTGFGDLELKARLGILTDGPVVVSLQPLVKIPLYKNDAGHPGPALGTGDVDIEAKLLAGSSFHPLPYYLTGGIGYRHRTGKLHDEVVFNAEAGATFEKLNLKLEFRGVKNTNTPPDIYGGPIQLPLPGGGGVVPVRLFGDQDYVKLIGEVVYKLSDRVGFSGGIFHMLHGKNIVAGTTYQIGLVLLR